MSLATLTLPETLAGIRERGLRMEVAEYTLRCGPKASLTDPLREALRAYKRSLLPSAFIRGCSICSTKPCPRNPSSLTRRGSFLIPSRFSFGFTGMFRQARWGHGRAPALCRKTFVCCIRSISVEPNGDGQR